MSTKEHLPYTDYWDNTLRSEFEKETDRGAVIVAATLLENRLEDLIKHYLVPQTSANDELFDIPNAPLSNFSAKISLSFRLGLVSKSFTRDLHIIRKIRNDFAHDLESCDFNHSSVKSRISEIFRSCKMENERSHKRYPKVQEETSSL